MAPAPAPGQLAYTITSRVAGARSGVVEERGFIVRWCAGPHDHSDVKRRAGEEIKNEKEKEKRKNLASGIVAY